MPLLHVDPRRGANIVYTVIVGVCSGFVLIDSVTNEQNFHHSVNQLQVRQKPIMTCCKLYPLLEVILVYLILVLIGFKFTFCFLYCLE